MRRIAGTLLFALLFLGLVGPVLYLWYAADLPDLSSAEAIRAALAARIEADRKVLSIATGREVALEFEVLPRAQLPNVLVSAVLALEACPEFFEVPQERGLERLRRLGSRLSNSRGGAAGPGRCQLRFADEVSEALGVADRLHAVIADWKVLSALDLEGLFTYRLASTFYAPGVFGTRQASFALFGREPARLELSQIAELIAAEKQYPAFSTCKNPPRLRLLRDDVLNRLEGFGQLEARELARAKARPVECTLRP
jgi:hypothetical protein